VETKGTNQRNLTINYKTKGRNIMKLKLFKPIGIFLAVFLWIVSATSILVADDLKVALAAEPTSMDPHYQNLTINNSFATQIYSALVLQDANQNLVPGLASSWKPVDDRTWEFALRKNVKFHNGSAFTSEDVIASMERAANVPNSPSSFATFTKGKKFTVVDDFTIRVSTEKPNPFTPNDMSRISIIDSAFVKATTEDFNTGVASYGTGPFTLTKWLPGDLIEIARNDNYWGEAMEWDRIIVKPIKDGTTRTAALISGDVDFIERVAPADLPTLEKRKGISVFKSVSNRLLYMTLHMTDNPVKPYVTDKNGTPIKSPFEDIRMRKAVSHAINRVAISQRVMDGLSSPAGQFSPEGYIGYSSKLVADPYNPTLAKKLMAEAGYSDGFKLTVHGPAGRYSNDARILEAIAQMLSSIGIETSVETMPASVFFKRFARGGPDKKPEFTAAMSGYANGSGEPSHPLRIFIHTKQKERGYGPGNRNGYSNAEVDKMIEDGRASMDIEKGEKAFIKATEIAMGEYALIPIHHEVATWAAREGISYENGALDSTFLHNIRK
jgi:peptide/nickel transport system substrate-binding protein